MNHLEYLQSIKDIQQYKYDRELIQQKRADVRTLFYDKLRGSDLEYNKAMVERIKLELNEELYKSEPDAYNIRSARRKIEIYRRVVMKHI
jgi:hypothetical protein